MKNKYLGLIFMSTTILQAQQFPDIKAPVAEKQEHIREIHGDKVSDPYYWMIDYFKKGTNSAKVVDYLKAENTYWTDMMKDTEPFREKLFLEMKNRIKEKDESVPVFRKGYYYYTRTEAGKQYFKYCRKKGDLKAPEEILLDVDKLAEGHAYYAASGFSISPDNMKMIYGVDDVSRRQYKLFLKDLSTGKTTDLGIINTTGSATWANDNKTIFYTAKNPETLLTEKIFRHSLGTDPSKDVLVYEEKDKSNYIGVGKSKNEKFIMISSGATTSSEIRYLDADDPAGTFKIFQPRMKDVIYDVTPLEDRFLVTTNKDALNFKVVETPLDKTGVENWKDFIPHRTDVLMEGITEFKNYLVFSERQNGLSQLVIYDRKTGKKEFLKFDEPVYTVYSSGNPEYNTDNFRFGYTSMITPSSQFEQNLKTGKRILLKQQEVLGGYDKNNYKTERLFATAKDGTKIPISIVYKKGYKKDGKAPLLLYAYGSYGNSMDATFSSTRLSLLDRGFAYAIAHIRGGQEMGRQWYEDGKMMKKKNTFTDFIDAGEYLVNQKYTSPKHLYAQGGSAGGLLMGAVVNMKPDLWNGVISQVPFVDVVNTMLDESIPLTTNEYDEWGNPNNKEAYFYMKSYSPYENVEKKNYPNILVTTGLHDSQVQYFEPAKWVARLRDMKTDKNVLLLKTDMDYGHGGASGRFDYLKDVALVYAFMFKLEGINK
ncbi:S9 family peptidase [Elizabethkingia anophelis]|uniref:S9 family peptidase n=1 Tax=Elizabethkingia anophelis TaxID=1117645 RepID=UPI00200C8BF6|nr:S9 family peptidase [Elizabethkingia anophelis]MCL1032574.1 S9 family peptidase [Elizabethkingia anophelis]MCW2465513.1 oligopeptidase B [Elizabethkingia anophelis]MCW2469197.1 oligopeptidase B [Elizabethkingia anophelis]MCW2472881.1 oligopeptidase B [Elizabethkingia anophelis]HBI9692839.1 S9 family peptidase [Elizabethkingia anophelis]